jgi:hypothetical protein
MGTIKYQQRQHQIKKKTFKIMVLIPTDAFVIIILRCQRALMSYDIFELKVLVLRVVKRVVITF